jgi:hypothetical protein
MNLQLSVTANKFIVLSIREGEREREKKKRKRERERERRVVNFFQRLMHWKDISLISLPPYHCGRKYFRVGMCQFFAQDQRTNLYEILIFCNGTFIILEKIEIFLKGVLLKSCLPLCS